MLRLRQVCLVAADIGAVESDIEALFGTVVCFRDPAVAQWGLENVLYPIGNQFLEVVAPTRGGTAASRYLQRRNGDGGYIVILQCDEIERRRARMAALGVRIINELQYGGYVGIQLHPRDIGGAMLETSWNEGDDLPDGPWHPAGADWRKSVRTDRVNAMHAADIQGNDPARMAARWGDVLEVVPQHTSGDIYELPLDDAVLRFVPVSDGRAEGLACVDLAAADVGAVLSAARLRNCPADGNIVTVGGTRFRLV